MKHHLESLAILFILDCARRIAEKGGSASALTERGLAHSADVLVSSHVSLGCSAAFLEVPESRELERGCPRGSVRTARTPPRLFDSCHSVLAFAMSLSQRAAVMVGLTVTTCSLIHCAHPSALASPRALGVAA